MKYITMKNSFLSVAVVAMALGFSAPALAAGPLAVCESGEPFLWANGGTDIVYNLDQGDLGPVTAADASALIRTAFDAWENIPTSSLSYVEGENISVDVDITNFGPFLNPVAPDGLSAIVFDDSGEIFDLLFGPGSGILGFAGPEFTIPATCTIIEGSSFLNGPSFTDLTAAVDISVHEFGHFSNFAHAVVNGQLFIGLGDSAGPGPGDNFPVPPGPPIIANGQAYIETMYPFYFGPAVGTQTPAADDIASASTLYPAEDFAGSTGTIAGTVFLGQSKRTGVNVIARNLSNPFFDAVSAISSDFTDSTLQSDPIVGTYRITGLTPGAQYAVYIDEILDGGFSTTPLSPLPGPEEFYNGPNESGDSTTDDPQVFEAITAMAGLPSEGIDIFFNIPPPGSPLPTGDDGNVEIPLSFDFCVAGQSFNSVIVNGNGFLTLGGADNSFFNFLPNENAFLSGPARMAGLWTDLSPNQGGQVVYHQTPYSFSAVWQGVPEFGGIGSNSFLIHLAKNSGDCTKSKHGYGFGSDVLMFYGDMTAENGIAGFSAGGFAASGFETEDDLSRISRYGFRKIRLRNDAAVFESFTDNDQDLEYRLLRFDDGGRAYRDRFERNNGLDRASKVTLAFDSIDTRRRFTGISPSAADVDFYRFNASAGNTLLAEIVTGQIDSVMGLWYCGDSKKSGKPGKCDPDTAIFIAANDDKGFGPNPLLSGFLFDVPIDGTYALGVTFCCDFDFDGVAPGQGAPLDEGRYVLDVFEILPEGQ